MTMGYPSTIRHINFTLIRGLAKLVNNVLEQHLQEIGWCPAYRLACPRSARI